MEDTGNEVTSAAVRAWINASIRGALANRHVTYREIENRIRREIGPFDLKGARGWRTDRVPRRIPLSMIRALADICDTDASVGERIWLEAASAQESGRTHSLEHRGPSLDYSGRGLTAVPPEVMEYRWLKELNLSNNRISVLPPEIAQLDELSHLRLNDNRLSALPAEIGQLSQLVGLYVDRNMLRFLPSEIGQLTELTDLHLDGNLLTTLPPEVGSLSKLTRLDLDGNQLSMVPPEFWRLSNLTELHLDRNRLIDLPPEVGHLTNLRRLDLDGNLLEVVPPEIGRLTQLTILYLDDNQLKVLPREIGQLTKLTELYLNDNRLTEVPSEIGELANLRVLYLDDNGLTDLPKEIGQLNALTRFHLDGNRLMHLPREMGLLSELSVLLLDRNELRSVAPEIFELPELSRFTIHGNPLRGGAFTGHAFISYVHEDRIAVDGIQAALEIAGVRVWRDTAELWPGEDWRIRIRKAITDDSLVFIACFSESAVQKEATHQREEILLAIDQLRLRKLDEPWLIPVRLSDCVLPYYDLGAGRTLDSLQRVDVFGDQTDEGERRLIRGVWRVLAKTS